MNCEKDGSVKRLKFKLNVVSIIIITGKIIMRIHVMRKNETQIMHGCILHNPSWNAVLHCSQIKNSLIKNGDLSNCNWKCALFSSLGYKKWRKNNSELNCKKTALTSTGITMSHFTHTHLHRNVLDAGKLKFKFQILFPSPVSWLIQFILNSRTIWRRKSMKVFCNLLHNTSGLRIFGINSIFPMRWEAFI